jgi:hypothetical protein
MEEEKETALQDTIVCPRDTANRYFKSFCEAVFRNSKYRPYCLKCLHFTAAVETATQKAMVTGAAKHQP